jgi:hypothetical protein
MEADAEAAQVEVHGLIFPLLAGTAPTRLFVPMADAFTLSPPAFTASLVISSDVAHTSVLRKRYV